MKAMPNPTRRQREQVVVELLRCGMDCWLCALPFSAAVERCAPSRAVESLAYKAWRVVFNEAKRDRLYGVQLDNGEWFVSMQFTMLEAAARIEEGWWPNG